MAGDLDPGGIKQPATNSRAVFYSTASFCHHCFTVSECWQNGSSGAKLRRINEEHTRGYGFRPIGRFIWSFKTCVTA